MKKVTKLTILLIVVLLCASKINFSALQEPITNIEENISIKRLGAYESFDLKTLIFAKFDL